ncbi:hypothetical protein Tco_0251793 [Tanacetum coccineum]
MCIDFQGNCTNRQLKERYPLQISDLFDQLQGSSNLFKDRYCGQRSCADAPIWPCLREANISSSIAMFAFKEGLDGEVVADALSREGLRTLKGLGLSMTLAWIFLNNLEMLRRSTKAGGKNTRKEMLGGMLVENSKDPEKLRTEKLGNNRQGRTSETIGFVSATRDTSMEVDNSRWSLSEASKHHKTNSDEIPFHNFFPLEDMLRACVIDLWIWLGLKNLALVSFSYNNSYHASNTGCTVCRLYGLKSVVHPYVGRRLDQFNSWSRYLVPEESKGGIIQIKQRIQTARDRQKSYADLKRKPMEFQVGDKVMLKVSPWKGVVRFGKRGKLNPRLSALRRSGDEN